MEIDTRCNAQDGGSFSAMATLDSWTVASCFERMEQFLVQLLVVVFLRENRSSDGS